MPKPKLGYLDSIEHGANLRGVYDEATGVWDYLDEQGRDREALIEAYQEHASKLDKVSGVYQKADRIITGEDIEVSVVHDPEMDTTAMNNGREIIFNSNLIEDLDSETIASLHGLNYHEIGHILFSPRAGSNLGQYVKDNKYVRAFNLLEEGRSETLLSNKYPSARLFLEANVSDYLLKNNPSEWGEMFPVITGRKYLDIELRQVIADKFIAKYGAELAEDIHFLVHNYRSLVFPTDFDKAKELVSRMAKLVGLDDTPPPSWNKDSHGDRPILTKGRPASTKEQERLQDKEGKEGGSESLSGNPSDGDKITDGDRISQAYGMSGDYTGEENYLDKSDNDIAHRLNERMKDITANPIVAREVKDTRKAIIGSDEMRASIRKANYLDMTPRDSALNYARRFGTELERMVKDNDPHWEKFLPSGKLNISRTMSPDVNAISEMFDVWDTGNPNTEIEAVILMDNSSSMGGRMKSVCESAWIIKRGIETIDGSVSVYSFSHESKSIYDKKEKAKPRSYRYMEATGSTNPMRGLIEAERALSTSTKPVKMLFIVTDGYWDRTEECDSIIKRLNNAGVITCVVFIGQYEYYKSLIEDSKAGLSSAVEHLQMLKHGAQVFKAVVEAKDMLSVATDLVKSTLSIRK